ncbi:hypothetical protein OQA88_12626 [Cercophora sp. LCS_1]
MDALTPSHTQVPDTKRQEHVVVPTRSLTRRCSLGPITDASCAFYSPVLCAWLDKDHAEGKIAAALKIHLPGLTGEDDAVIGKDPNKLYVIYACAVQARCRRLADEARTKLRKQRGKRDSI